MKIELKHLAAYLPYQLNCFVDDDDNNCVRMELSGITTASSYECCDFVTTDPKRDETVCVVHVENVTPILKPLSDITTEILDITPYWTIEAVKQAVVEMSMPYCIFVYMVEHHFDVFGLIDAGLAIDINALQQ